MKHKYLNIFLMLFLTFLLWHCSRISDTAGATSETTNGELVAFVQYTNGQPASGVKILLIDRANWINNLLNQKNQVLDSVTTDSHGKFRLSIPLQKKVNLQFEASEGLLFKNIQDVFSEESKREVVSFSLLKYGGLTGSIQGGFEKEIILKLAGTSYTSEISSTGTFNFVKVPPGQFEVVAASKHTDFMPLLVSSADVPQGDGILQKNLSIVENSILIDDFEFGWNQSVLGRLMGNGWWYKHNDKEQGGMSSIYVSIFDGAIAYRGKSIRATYILDKDIQQPWAMIGIQFGDYTKKEVYDMSTLKSISFWAKGKGSVNVKFLSQTITDTYSDWYQYYTNVALSENWQYIQVETDSLKLPDRASDEIKKITWNEAAKDLHTIDFTVEYPESNPGDTVELWLDDLMLHGINLSTFSIKKE